nr:unnamed protein product [Naegleria fowleri]
MSLRSSSKLNSSPLRASQSNQQQPQYQQHHHQQQYNDSCNNSITFSENSSIERMEGFDVIEDEAKTLISIIFNHEPLPNEISYDTAIRVLKEYHKACFSRGEYDQCEIGKKAMLLLKFQNEKRHIDNIKRIQMKEREEIELAFQQEMAELKSKWDEKLVMLEQSFEESRRRLLDKHAKEMEDFQEKFMEDLQRKYNPKSRDLITLKMMEETLARQEFYFEAISVKKKAEKLQEEEMKKVMMKYSSSYEKKKAHLLKKQQHELDSLDLRLRREKSESIQQKNREIEQVTLRYSNLKSTAQIHHSQFESKARTSLIKSNTSLISSIKRMSAGDTRPLALSAERGSESVRYRSPNSKTRK